jgi:hypothetical protein
MLAFIGIGFELTVGGKLGAVTIGATYLPNEFIPIARAKPAALAIAP